MLITSSHNETLKEVRRLNARRRDRESLGRFVAEGEDLLAAAESAGWTPLARLVAHQSGLEGIEVTPALLAGVSQLGSGTRALGIYPIRWAQTAAGPLCLYLHGVADPGNLGTILRSAEAFGAATVVLGPGCADPFGPKAVRASMGAIFTVPVLRGGVETLPGRRLALDPNGPRDLRAVLAEPVASGPSDLPEGDPDGAAAASLTLLLGAEREGLPADVLEVADTVARIPVVNHSLNVAMAAAVALYELASRMPLR
jgi:TrmH family RNA methyltransferase